MAFNPFHRFRKHQKAFFAVLTIICMFVFVLQFGAGDPLTRMMDFFGAHKAQGAPVTTLNGVTFYTSDLDKLERRRQIADTFVRGILEQARETAFQEAANLEKAAGPEAKDPILAFILEGRQRRRFAQFLGEDLTPQAWLDQIRSSITILHESRKTKPDKAGLYDPLIAALNFEYWETNPDRPRNSFYFGGTTDPEDLLDFALWQQQADRLGIVLNTSDMLKALNRETGRPDFLLPDERARFIKQGFQELTEEELDGALIDEFRAVIAQEALLGEPASTRGPAFHGEGVDQSPATFSSLDFLQFFRENRTTLKVALLNVPVATFKSNVQGAPAENELSRLFEKYKEQEPAPERDEPGFKEPRRTCVEYVTARADSPFYQTLARNRIILPTVGRVGAFLNTYAAGGGVAWAAAASSLPPWTDEPVQREYDNYKERVPSWIHPALVNSVHDSSFLRAENFAALVGQIGVNGLTGAPVWTSGMTMEGSAFGHEIQARLRVIPASVLAGATAATNLLASASIAYPYTPPLASLQDIHAQMIDVALHVQAPILLHHNLALVVTKVYELRTKPEEARKFIDQAIKDYGLDHKAMSQLKDQYAIADDPALKVLKEAYAEAGVRQAPKFTFAQALFLGKGVYEPMLFSGEFGLVTTRGEQASWEVAKDPFLYWRTQDKAAQVRTLDEASADVKAAWARLEAQRLARKAAERIDAEVRKRNSPVDVVQFLREQKQGPVDELTNVSLLVQGVGPGRYQPYRPSAAIIAYPRRNFVETLLTMKKPGDSVVIRDQPESNYYVAVLLERSEPKIDNEFVEVYAKTPLRDSMMQRMFLEQRRRQFRTRLMDQLRAEAGPVNTSGRFKIPENLNLRRSEMTDEG